MNDLAELEISLSIPKGSAGEGTAYDVLVGFNDPERQTRPPKKHGEVLFSWDVLDHLDPNDEEERLQYGQQLFDDLFFTPGVKEKYKAALQATRLASNPRPLRLRLEFIVPEGDEYKPDPQFTNLRWETLYDGERWLASNANMPFSRFLETIEEPPRRTKGELRALVVIANPGNLAEGELCADGEAESPPLAVIDVKAEKERAQACLGELYQEPDVLVSDPYADPPVRVTLDNLVGKLSKGRGYDIVYLVCHGGVGSGDNPLPEVLLEGPDGNHAQVPAADLAGGIAALAQEIRPRLFVLASCYSGGGEDITTADEKGILAALGPQLVWAGVPAVLAMQGSVTMLTMQDFMPVFFDHLLKKNEQIDVAVAAARNCVRSRPDSWMPVLFMSLKNGNIWDATSLQIGDIHPPNWPIWVGVPAMPNHFVGRDELVHDLASRLTDGDYQALAVEAKAGAGKTTLAVALAHHSPVHDHFKDGVLWAGLGPTATEGQVVTILNRWGSALGIDVTGEAEVTQRKQAVADAIGQRRLLIVIDDAWDIDVARLLRFGNPHCGHLLTTRDEGLARQFAGTKGTFSVPTLSDDAAFELLRELAPEACAADPVVAKALAHSVGGLPLALELVGGYLTAPERSLLPRLSKAALQVMMDPQQRLRLAQERLGAPGRAVTLQDTIFLSLEGLRELANGAAAESAFYALGAFAPLPERFSWEAAEAVAEVDSATLALLVARNLVDDATGEQLALHQTLADVAQTRLDEAAQTRHRSYYLSLVDENREDWHRIEPVYGQVRWAWSSVPEDKEMLDLVESVSLFQRRRGLWRDKLEWSMRGLRLVEVKEWHREEAKLLNDIGAVCVDLGLEEEALEYYNQALPIEKEVSDRAGEATTLNGIGVIYQGLGQPEKALDYFNRALSIREEVEDRVGQATTLNGIGVVYQGLGQPEKALDYFNRALSIREEEGVRAGQAATLNNIGAVYQKDLGQPEKALDYYNQALPIREEVGDRAGQATTLNNIGAVYHDLGQPEKALDYYNQALPIREEVGDREGLNITLHNMAMAYQAQGRLVEAQAALEQTVEVDLLLKSHNLGDDASIRILGQAEVEYDLAEEEEE